MENAMPPRARQHTVKAWSHHTMLFELYSYAPGPAEALPKHVHEAYQLCLSVDFPGEYYYRGTHYTVPTGSLSVIHPGEIHAARDLQERQRSTTFRVVYVSPALFHTAATEVAGRASSLPFFAAPIIIDVILSNFFSGSTSRRNCRFQARKGLTAAARADAVHSAIC